MKTSLLGRFTSSPNINRLRLAFQPDGSPIVAYHDGDTYAGGPLVVQRWDGAAWINYPTIAASALVRALAIHPNDGQPWMVYQIRSGNQFFINVTRWDGALWVAVGNGIETQDRINPGETEFNMPGRRTLAFNPLTQQPVLLADDTVANDRRLRAYALNGAEWTALGAPLSINHNRESQLAFAADGTLYVAYCEGYGNTTDLDFVGIARSYANGGIADRVTIKQWNGAAWITQGVGPPGAVYLALAVDPITGTPWIAYRNRDQSSMLTVRRWTSGTLWEYVGQAAIASAEHPMALEFSASGRAALMNMGGYSGAQIWTFTPGAGAGTWTQSYEIETAIQNNNPDAAAFAPGDEELSCAVLLNQYGNPAGGSVARRVPPATIELSNSAIPTRATLRAASGAALAPDEGLWWTTYNPETQVWSIGLSGILLAQLRLSLHERADPTDTPIGSPVVTVIDATPGAETLALDAVDLPVTASGLLELRARQSVHGREGPYSVLHLHNQVSFTAFNAARDSAESSLIQLAWTFSGAASGFTTIDEEDHPSGSFDAPAAAGALYLSRWIGKTLRMVALDENGNARAMSAPVTIAAQPPTIDAPTLTSAWHDAEGNVYVGIALPDGLSDMPETPVGGGEA
ncbi:MAG: hypothetical protein P9F19_15930 [Candidatus Contendobacter sp.]|nr:hypothetical protein [Candidatus Contendobacter sp.]MDG4558861.1 hypothetical protein [Candidatus Contendobacter sp.]